MHLARYSRREGTIVDVIEGSVLLKRQLQSQLDELKDELAMHNSPQYACTESSFRAPLAELVAWLHDRRDEHDPNLRES